MHSLCRCFISVKLWEWSLADSFIENDYYPTTSTTTSSSSGDTTGTLINTPTPIFRPQRQIPSTGERDPPLPTSPDHSVCGSTTSTTSTRTKRTANTGSSSSIATLRRIDPLGVVACSRNLTITLA